MSKQNAHSQLTGDTVTQLDRHISNLPYVPDPQFYVLIHSQ